MPTDPRSTVLRFDENDYHGQTYAYDGTLTGPALGQMGATVSPSVGLAVAVVSDGTVGLGAAASSIIGKTKVVSDDGHCTVQDEGYMLLPKHAADPIAAGDPAECDGAGAVQKGTVFKGARCVAQDATTVTVKI